MLVWTLLNQYPVSEHGNIQYISVALPKIETERVTEALLDIYSRVGFPPEDPERRGWGWGQFTSEMMAEVS